MEATTIPRDNPVLSALPPKTEEHKGRDGSRLIQQFTFNDRLRKTITLVVPKIDIVISKGDMILVTSTTRIGFSSAKKARALYRVKKIWIGTEVITIKAGRAN